MVLRKGKISPQYWRKEMIEVTIVEVKSPSHYIVKESPSVNPTSQAKKFVETEDLMQKYYNSIEEPFAQLPLKDTYVIVLHQKKFFRAQVRSILNKCDGHVLKVYLVDYGIECSVPRDCVFQIHPDFMNTPFQAVQFKLIMLEPLSLVMNTPDLVMEYKPVTEWDTAAVAFVADLHKDIFKALIVVKGSNSDSLFGSLFITLKDEEIVNLNEELVSRKFATENVSLLPDDFVHIDDSVMDEERKNNKLVDASHTEIQPETTCTTDVASPSQEVRLRSPLLQTTNSNNPLSPSGINTRFASPNKSGIAVESPRKESNENERKFHRISTPFAQVSVKNKVLAAEKNPVVAFAKDESGEKNKLEVQVSSEKQPNEVSATTNLQQYLQVLKNRRRSANASMSTCSDIQSESGLSPEKNSNVNELTPVKMSRSLSTSSSSATASPSEGNITPARCENTLANEMKETFESSKSKSDDTMVKETSLSETELQSSQKRRSYKLDKLYARLYGKGKRDSLSSPEASPSPPAQSKQDSITSPESSASLVDKTDSRSMNSLETTPDKTAPKRRGMAQSEDKESFEGMRESERIPDVIREIIDSKDFKIDDDIMQQVLEPKKYETENVDTTFVNC